MFLGEFEHSLDAKRRLAIPAEIRSAWDVAVHGAGLVAVPGSNGHLWLWPQKSFQSAVEAQKREFMRDPESVNLETHLFSKAAPLEFDTAGRVRIPDRLLEPYELREKVMILGIYDHLEVVSAGDWQAESLHPKQLGQLWGAAMAARKARNP